MSSTARAHDFSSPQESLRSSQNAEVAGVVKVLEVIGSLKLTCVLFALSMVIVFTGSLAQSRRDVWQVMEQYFRTWVAYIDVQDLFPPSMFSGLAQYYAVEDFGAAVASTLGPLHRLPFPGGWSIGLVMLLNLTSAHALRFRVRARGNRLAAGLLLILTGLLMTFAVVWTGNLQTGVEFGNTLLTPITIWYLMLTGLAIAGIAGVATAVMTNSGNALSRWILGSVGLILLAVAVAFLYGGEAARFNLSNMRILWQLLKGGACALVLLLGSNLVFEKRGGIAVLHFGVALLMISELQVGLQAKENMLSLMEGESTSFVRDIRVRELAIITQKAGGKDDVVAVPESRLADAAWYAARAKSDVASQIGGPVDPNQLIPLPELPFDIAVRQFYRNSILRAALPDDKLRLGSGLGSFSVAKELPPVTGMEEANDTSAVYVDLIAKDSGKVLNSILLSQNVSELRGVPIAEKVTIAGKDYQFYLRFQRSYQPYTVKLNDVSRTNYIGTSTPRDYRSEIEITEVGSDTPEKFSVWMNNPLRFKGETFYQTGHQALGDGKEMTTLSVVNNQGWMLPYIACMIVMVGMFGQFGQTLSRFLDRTVRDVNYAAVPSGSSAALESAPGQASSRAGAAIAAAARPAMATPAAPETTPFVLRIGIPALVAVLAVGWLASKSFTPKEKPDAMNLYGFAQLPVAWSGRPQPIDSMARMQLLAASHKSTFEGELDAVELSSPERRKKILAAIAKGWPNVASTSLSEFHGSYPEWIAKIAELTASGEDAIEARVRSVMVRKMPAVQWLLDATTHPEVAARHRIYKIEDDQLLSLLGLEKRGGLTYSLVEIQKNFKALEPVLKEAHRKQENKLENTMTPIERRVGALFDTMGRIDQLSQVFILRESDGLLGAYVDSWRVLLLLGTTAPVSPVPTGSTDEQRAFETMIAANSVRQLNDRMTENHLVTLDDFKAYVHDTLPGELVTRSITGSYRILKEGAGQNSKPGAAAGEDVQLQAKAAAIRVQDEFLREILKVIAEADPKLTPEEIAAAVPAERIREIAAARISSEMFEVFSTISERKPDDKRLMAIRTRLQKIAAEDPQVLSSAMNEELIQLVWDDLQARVGHLMPGGKNFAGFNANALAWKNILTSWKQGDAAAFNQGLHDYHAILKADELPHLNPQLVKLEAWFNYFEPFYLAICLYLPIIVMSFFGWLFFGKVFRNTSLALLAVAFVLHTAALILRMWISGRPPVTNLYSSAIFIGWAVVLGSFFVEMLMKRGIGNLLGASVGAATLVIAHYLARDEGDNLGVMQAVLDTTFWLATHVVCITLGYAATFLAGCMGFAYCVMALINYRRSGITAGAPVTPELKLFGKMVYGVICFALFFSLVGTVLGGLWADDSWGRFWGWDPKENGAMMIVIWNAFILHARWDKMVRDYGTAVLAMIGNVVTAWSWFGVNELKAGLHTYGFTEGRLLAMLLFIAIQLTFVLAFATTAVVIRKYFSPTAKLKNA